MDSPVEIEVSVSTTCEWGLCATAPITAEEQPEIAEIVSTLVSGDRPETDISQENNPKPHVVVQS